MVAANYPASVFINCPFDADYQPILHAIVFAVHDCGFVARCALEEDNSAVVRIRKITRIIDGCQLAIHDLSRTEPDGETRLPRFNMPLELGLFLGAMEFGSRRHREKRCLILEREPWLHQKYCSDLAGQEIRAHADSPDEAIRAVRRFLASALAGKVMLPSWKLLCSRYAQFLQDLPAACEQLPLDLDELQFFEVATLASEWMQIHRW